MEICAAIWSQYTLFFWYAAEPTVSMTVVLDGDAEHLEDVHADGGVLDSLLALENHVDGSREEANEGVAFAGG